MSATSDREREIRQLRRRIARLRRRIDGRIRSTQRSGRKLLCWRTYVQRLPGNAMAAALGLGLALSGGLSARRLSRWLGMRLLRQAFSRFTQQMWKELGRIWEDSTPKSTDGADHG